MVRLPVTLVVDVDRPGDCRLGPLRQLGFALDRQSSCPIPFSKLATFRSRPTRLRLEGGRVGGINVAEGETMERMAEMHRL